MSVRRAEYREGAGLLAADDGRLFFLIAVDHPYAAMLMDAASDKSPLHALKAVVTNATSDVPPFVYIESAEGIQGVACGEIQLEIIDDETSVVDGTSSDLWVRLSSSADAIVCLGAEQGGSGDLWLESGVVRASSFRWAPRGSSMAPPSGGSADSDAPTAERRTLDRPASPKSAATAPKRTRSKRKRAAEAARQSGTDAAALTDRRVDALVCLECGGLNPPMTARCASCTALLWGANSEVRTVEQPALGVIHLSDQQLEPLDSDLLIGRNPARFGIQPHQREVVQGIGDLSVSRLHIELILDGWTVKAINHKPGAGTSVETRLGGSERLPSGSPRQLEDGDTIYFGTVWFRYEKR